MVRWFRLDHLEHVKHFFVISYYKDYRYISLSYRFFHRLDIGVKPVC